MKRSEIKFTIELDAQKMPEHIYWEATDNPNEGLEQTQAISLAVWDSFHKGTLKIDLWTKDMEVFDMKRFCIETISGLSDTLRNATGDERMAQHIEATCKQLSQWLDEEMKKAR
jgi:gliding motility-associated protein GldC